MPIPRVVATASERRARKRRRRQKEVGIRFEIWVADISLRWFRQRQWQKRCAFLPSTRDILMANGFHFGEMPFFVAAFPRIDRFLVDLADLAPPGAAWSGRSERQRMRLHFPCEPPAERLVRIDRLTGVSGGSGALRHRPSDGVAEVPPRITHRRSGGPLPRFGRCSPAFSGLGNRARWCAGNRLHSGEQ